MTPGEQYLLVEALRAVMAAVRDDEERYFADLAIDRLEAVLVAKQAAAASGAEEDAPETAATAEPTALDAETSILQHHWADWTEETV